MTPGIPSPAAARWAIEGNTGSSGRTRTRMPVGGRSLMPEPLVTPTIKRLLRDEARARWAIKALEAKLKDKRPSPDELRAFAKAAGAGHSDTIYDENGRP